MVKHWFAGLALAALVAAPAMAQEHKEMKHDEGKGMMQTAWKEMNAFHAVMHLMHQPLMKSGDLTQVKGHASHLAQLADSWAKSKAPAECHAPANAAESVTGFAAEVAAFAKTVEAGGADDQLKAGFDKVHDKFETLHGVCKPAKGGHNH